MKSKVILVINDYKYSLKDIIKDKKIYELKPAKYKDIYYKYDNLKDDIYVINIGINYIEKLKEIVKYLKPDIVFIPCVDKYTDNINKKMFKYIKKSLKNNTLVINSNDKYLNKMFYYNFNIYSYGNNLYDDIEFIDKDNNIIFKYNDKKYYIKNKEKDILGYILIGLLFNIDINNIIEQLS